MQSDPYREDKTTTPDCVITVVRIGISLIVLTAALYVVLSQEFSNDYTKWATGMVGIVVGYWLR